MILRLSVPLPKSDGGYELLTFDVPVQRARHVRNDHNHADELEVSVDWIDTGVDPRWIAGAICEFYMGQADARGEWSPTADDLRFVGRMVKPARSGRGDTLTVELLFHDYTSFFLLAKPYASEGVPYYDEDLEDAWIRICQNVPGVEQLADNLVLRGLDAAPVIGSAVAPRFRSKGQVPVKPDMDAWAIWQKCVGMMGLISFFELDQLIVTTATDYYSLTDPPRIVWGRDLLDFTEERNNDRTLKGVGITSFDPITGNTLESLYNPLIGNKRKLKPAAKTRKKPITVNEDKEYDIFAYPGITDQAALDALAKRVYEERARQELEGTLTTTEMSLLTSGGRAFDLLSLGAGDAIDVRFLDSDDAAFVKNFDSVEQRTRYLVNIGYQEPVARIIASNVDTMTTKSNLFHVKSVTTEMETNADGGSFRVEVSYCNKIDPGAGGGAAAA